MDEVTNAPTYIKGSYPTKLPRIGTGPGSNAQAIGYPGKLIAAAAGDEPVDCSNVIGGMAGCTPPPSVDDACKISFLDGNHRSDLLCNDQHQAAICHAGLTWPGYPFGTWLP